MYAYVKRAIDIVCALLGLALTSPLWIVAIVGILASDWGPVFYKASRIGKGNRPFKMYKFRSMTVARAVDECSLRPEEARIFPFGHFIRKFKIDELPQLLNILTGDMSLIGPRPVAVDQFDMFRTGKWAEAARVPVGLSGPAALYDYIYGDAITDEQEYMQKVYPTRRELEYVYVQKCCFIYDLKMLVYTLVAILYNVCGMRCAWMLKELVDSANKTIHE